MGIISGTSGIARAYAAGTAGDGGLVGLDNGTTGYDACYWNGDVNANALGWPVDGTLDPVGTVGLSDAELRVQGSYAGFDFVNVWVMGGGDGYAELL